MRLALLSFVMAVAFPLSADGPFPPHRVAGNIYYVGSEDLASFLITTPEGHILINTSLEQTVPLIRASVERLGFQMKDIRVLLISHAHFDHCESLATVKAMTGAKVYVMKGDDDVVARGGAGQVYSERYWRPVKVDRVLRDGDKVELGGTTLVAHLTPGHTKGCTTWTLVTRDGGRSYNVVVVGSPNVNPEYKLVHSPSYPEIARDYVRTFAVLKSLPCDVFLGAHGGYYGMADKYARLGHGANPFVDPSGYRRFVEMKEREFYRKLHLQGGSL